MSVQRARPAISNPFEERNPIANAPPYQRNAYYPPPPEKVPPNYAPESSQAPKTVTIPSELFDKMFLALQNKPAADKAGPITFGNPTPL